MHTKITKKLLNVIDEPNVEACLIFFRVTCWLVFEKIMNNMLFLEKVVDNEELMECIRGDPVI